MAVDTSVSPYFDDFNEDKSFHRLLFRPGRAVQARELTQLQTILQNQISRFGQNIFLEGSVVVPGGASIDTLYEYVKIDEASLGSIIGGATVVGNNSGLEATVVQLVAAEGSDPNTLYIRYTGGGSSDGGRFEDGETITWTNPTTGSGTFTVSTNGTGTGTKIDLQKGVYFVRGYFAVATSQSLIVEKYGIPTGVQEIGLRVNEEVVTSNDDSSLLDNANETNNINAPGADRLKYSLTLIKREDALDSSGNFDVDYFTVATLKDANIVSQNNRSTYSLLGDEMARRTYDESGNYTLDPFVIEAKDHPSDNNKVRLSIDPGKAYVKGYEIDKPLPTDLDVDKALTTQTKNNGKISTYFGNYVRVTSLAGIPRIDQLEEVSLQDSGLTTRGTARVRAIEHESGSIYRVYLFEVSMNTGYAFNSVYRLNGGSNFLAILVDDENNNVNGNAKIYDVNKNSLLFRVPHNRVKSIQDITVRVQRFVTGTTDGSGNITLDTSSSSETWEDTSNWIISYASDNSIASGVSFGSSGAQTIALSGLTSSATINLVAYVDKTTATSRARTKTLTTVTDRIIAPNGLNEVFLNDFDIFELVSAKDTSNSDADITTRYTLDNGQRDNFYEEGKLILKAGETAPSGNVKVTFKHFNHGVGDYFNVDSYNSFLDLPDYDYGDIPSYKSANGTLIPLSDVFDFRPKKDSANSNFASTGSHVSELPKQNETIQGDIEYFLPRRDVIYLDSTGQFGVVKGNPSLNPQLRQAPSNSMAIYALDMGAGTKNSSDLKLTFLENKRYTMRDIGSIEKRIDKLEEAYTLNALELETSSLEVLDDAGNNRFKSGFYADNFKTHELADWENEEYRASIDPREGILRPEFVEKNARMVYKTQGTDGVSSSGVVKKGDFLLLDYTEVVEISQPLASSAINVNPYNVITNTGGITLSPESDEWRDVETSTSTNTVQDTNRVNPVQANNWNNWQWNWAGILDTEDELVTNNRANGNIGFNRNFNLDAREVAN